MGFAFEFTFKVTIEIFKLIIDLIFYSFVGLIQIVFSFQIQRLITFFLIVAFTIGDLYVVVPNMKSGIEPFIHLVILIMPLIYLSQIGKKGAI
ncbi:MAG: hypothetical protein ABF289_18470 [Clostridiales bacterium]